MAIILRAPPGARVGVWIRRDRKSERTGIDLPSVMTQLYLNNALECLT